MAQRVKVLDSKSGNESLILLDAHGSENRLLQAVL